VRVWVIPPFNGIDFEIPAPDMGQEKKSPF
jgi:hypothetical protein